MTMVSTTSALVAIVAMAGLLQMCPAPALGRVFAGVAAAGAIEHAATNKRDARVSTRGIPPGVSQESINLCTTAINNQHANGGSVKITDISQGTILVESVPATCMVLATVLSGHAAQEGGPVPVPMGVDSLQYTGVTAEDRRVLDEALGV